MSIRTELEATLAANKELVREIDDSNWKLRSAIPERICGQLAWHRGSSLTFIAGQIEGARNDKASNVPRFLVRMVFKANESRVRLASRKATPVSVLEDRDSGMARLLGVLDATDDLALARIATAFFGERRTIGEMLSRRTEHVTEHAADIRTVIRPVAVTMTTWWGCVGLR